MYTLYLKSAYFFQNSEFWSISEDHQDVTIMLITETTKLHLTVTNGVVPKLQHLFCMYILIVCGKKLYLNNIKLTYY